MAYQGPAENYDLDFRDSIVAPCATYPDTLVLVEGWDRQAAANEVNHAQLALGAVYAHFKCDRQDTMPCPAEDEVQAYVHHASSKRYIRGVRGRQEEVVSIVMRYLKGEGDDYEAMNELASQ